MIDFRRRPVQSSHISAGVPLQVGTMLPRGGLSYLHEQSDSRAQFWINVVSSQVLGKLSHLFIYLQREQLLSSQQG